MQELTLLQESTVEDSEIDSLGHMNVRYYVARVVAANERLFRLLGVSDELSAGQIIRRTDTCNRFHREQFAAARLHTSGGLVADPALCGSSGLTAYFEVRNPDSGDLASTFIVTSNVVDAVGQQQLECPEPAQHLRDQFATQVPDHGLPRSLSLAEPRAVSLRELERKVPPDDGQSMMNGRREGRVLAEDCDEMGRLREDVELMFLLHRPGREDQQEPVGPPVLFDDQGRRYSWAMMETRSVIRRRPNAGDAIVSIGADLRFGEKWRQTRRWVFDEGSGAPLGVHDHVALCIDLDARSAIAIPDSIRQQLAEGCLPEYV